MMHKILFILIAVALASVHGLYGGYDIGKNIYKVFENDRAKESSTFWEQLFLLKHCWAIGKMVCKGGAPLIANR